MYICSYNVSHKSKAHQKSMILPLTDNTGKRYGSAVTQTSQLERCKKEVLLTSKTYAMTRIYTTIRYCTAVHSTTQMMYNTARAKMSSPRFLTPFTSSALSTEAIPSGYPSVYVKDLTTCKCHVLVLRPGPGKPAPRSP